VGDQGSGEWSVAIRVSSENGARGVRRLDMKWAQNWFKSRAEDKLSNSRKFHGGRDGWLSRSNHKMQDRVAG